MATAELHVDSNQYTLPVVKASAGPDGIVVSKLRNDGWVTLDPGFLTTAPAAEAKPNAREATRTAQAAPEKRR